MSEFVANYWSYGVLAVVLLIATVTDIRRGRIYNVLTYPTIAIALMGHTLLDGLGFADAGRIGLLGSLAGLAAGFLPMLAVAFVGGINGGDVKLMAAVGALLGWRWTLATMFYTLIASALIAIVIMLYKGVFWRTLKRVGFFVLQAAMMHKPVDPASSDSPKVPFALAVLMGAAAALTEVLLRSPDALSFLGI